MKPCLYESTETEFKTNGIGKLSDCVSCVITEKRNGSYELEMEYPLDGIHAESLTEGNIILARPADNKTPQPFDIYKVETDLSGTMTISARHISYRLNFITVSPTSAVSGTYDQVNEAFKALKKNASVDCPFDFETDMESEAYFGILEPMSLRNALGGADGSMLDTFGGEFEWDYFTVRLLKSRGSDNGVRIVYGKNLTSYKEDKDSGDVITGVHPYWKDSETGDVTELSDKVVMLDTESPYDRVAVLDCSGEFDEEPTQEQLQKYAQSYIETTTETEPNIDIEIDFEALWDSPEYEDVAEAERVSLCDTVHVYVSTLGIEVDAKVTETEYDVLLERYKSITLSNSVTSSRNSSLSLTLATTSQVKSLIAMTDSSIRLTVSSIYATKATLENNYSTTVETKSLIEASENAVTLSFEKKLSNEYSTTEDIKSMIEASEEGIILDYTKVLNGYSTTTEVESMIKASEDGITLSYTKALADYSTTEDVKALIEASEEGITLSYTKALGDYSTTTEVESLIKASEEGIALTYTKNGEVRSQFAMEDDSITVKTGVITFESNSISIDSDNFKLTTSGEVSAKGSFTTESGDYKMIVTSGEIAGYYQGTDVGTISMKASRLWTVDGNTSTYRGIELESEDVLIKGTLVDVNADYFSVNYSSSNYYYGGTGSVKLVTGVEWTSRSCVADLSIDFSNKKASWSNLTYSTISSVSYTELMFEKGLMVTSI